MSDSTAFVQCAIDIYTFEGGRYSLSSAQVLSCDVQHSSTGGLFSFNVAPGGPNGVVGAPSWTEVITPMSTVVIAMQRGAASNVVMVGFAILIEELQTWTPAVGVTRTINVTGMDCSVYFNNFQWHLFPNLMGNINAVLGSQLSGTTQVLLGSVSGLPNQVANVWLENFMIGPSGILGNTWFNYGAQQVKIRDGLLVALENAPYADIPYGDNYYSESLSWAQRFQQIMPFPIYENILGTAPRNTWATVSPSGSIDYLPGLNFSSLGLPTAAPAVPQFVARVNRLPNLSTATVTDANVGYQFTGADTSLWKALPQFSLANEGFLSSRIQFGVNEYKNYYATNPTWMNGNYGTPNNVQPFAYLFYGLADPSSIHRYGFAPYVLNTRWWGDVTNKSNADGAPNIADGVVKMTARMASYAEPIPLLARGSVSMELRPDIYSCCLFNYTPFRDNTTWQFYINSIHHTWKFGGPSMTTLGLDRGLPLSVYTNADLLFNILKGNAQRQNGVYVSGLPSGLAGPALSQFGNTNQSQREELASIANAYVMPQFQ